jgi:hypothetical protein
MREEVPPLGTKLIAHFGQRIGRPPRSSEIDKVEPQLGHCA